MANAFEGRFNVAVLGAAGGIGQPLSLLLATDPNVARLTLYDVVPVVEGVAKDISHINKNNVVLGFAGDFTDKSKSQKALHATLKGADVVVIPAGLPRKPGMSRDDLFDKNATIVKELIEGCAEVCPKAMICIISNPVNSTVPIAAEVLKAKGVFDPKRLFGVSTLDIVRANKFVGEAAGIRPEHINVPVIGGHSGVTILPLLSQTTPRVQLTEAQIKALTVRIQEAGTEVVEAKKGGGSATLSMAYAGAHFAGSVMKGLKGEPNVVQCTFVYDPELQRWFASPVTLGLNGVAKIYEVDGLSEFEEKLLNESVLPELKKNITKGVQFVSSKL